MKQFYDDLYRVNPTIFGNRSVFLLGAILKRFPVARGNALDVGAGEGVSSNFLAEQGFCVDAIDISNFAFQSVNPSLSVQTFKIDLKNFVFSQEFTLANIALVAHHVEVNAFSDFLNKLFRYTKKGGIHVHTLITTGGDFYSESKKNTFFDNGENLNNIYKDWSILYDTREVVPASVTSAVNEVRSVVFQK